MSKNNFKVTTRKGKETVRRMIRDLPRMLSGKKNDIYGVREAFWGGFAYSLYNSIFKAYIWKSTLAKDDLGNSWPDLSPRTKAYRRAKKTTRTPLGLLTPTERKRWWSIYKQFKAFFIQKRKFPVKKAKAFAARKAWSVLKAEGAKTKLQVYGKEKFPVLIHKGRLVASLTPGAFNGTQYRARNRNQIFTVDRSGLTMGTRVKYAIEHHDPKKSYIPRRRLWPDNMSPWIRLAMTAGTAAAVRKLTAKL
jgi:hypothetical protein